MDLFVPHPSRRWPQGRHVGYSGHSGARGLPVRLPQPLQTAPAGAPLCARAARNCQSLVPVPCTSKYLHFFLLFPVLTLLQLTDQAKALPPGAQSLSRSFYAARTTQVPRRGPGEATAVGCHRCEVGAGQDTGGCAVLRGRPARSGSLADPLLQAGAGAFLGTFS